MKTLRLTEDQLFQLLLEALSKGMTLRQDQFSGNPTYKGTGKDLLTEWFNDEVKTWL